MRGIERIGLIPLDETITRRGARRARSVRHSVQARGLLWRRGV